MIRLVHVSNEQHLHSRRQSERSSSLPAIVRRRLASIGTIEISEVRAMKQRTTSQTSPPPVPYAPSNGSIDTATLELLAAWKAEDATTDPEKLREADEEIAAFKKAMNENRAATGAQPLFL